MNKVILVGRLTKDPEVKTTQNQVEFCSFTVAVDRRFKTANGERQADFINCVAWRQQAKLLGQYFQKGSRIGIVGNLQSRSYDDRDGKRVFVTEVSVDEIEFVDSKRDGSSGFGDSSASSSQTPPPALQTDIGFSETMDDNADLPFDI
ncbi:MAG: single-stranded DNA-binding protein [Clostridiaceae bacterium]|nr:single-stranded DNA-binding protein [Clostridiaceae bacterium]